MKWIIAAVEIAMLLCQSLGYAEDGEYYVSVWVHEHHSDADQQVVGWFDGNDNLQWVKDETHFRIYDTSHPAYQTDEYQQAFSSLPAIVLQRELTPTASGERRFREIKRWSGSKIPHTAVSLNHDLRRHTDMQLAGRRRKRSGGDCPDGVCSPDPPPLKVESLAAIEAARRAQEDAERRAEAAEAEEIEKRKQEEQALAQAEAETGYDPLLVFGSGFAVCVVAFIAWSLSRA